MGAKTKILNELNDLDMKVYWTFKETADNSVWYSDSPNTYLRNL